MPLTPIYNPFEPDQPFTIDHIPSALYYVLEGHRELSSDVRRRTVVPCLSREMADRIAKERWETGPVVLSGPPRNRKGVMLEVESD